MDKQISPVLAGMDDGLVTCQSNHGLDLQASILRLSPHHVAFEVYAPGVILRTSEVLSSFRIIIRDRAVYSGRAVISNVVNTGTMLVCEATLDDTWIDLGADSVALPHERWDDGFEGFVEQWQRRYKVLPDFKVVVADLHSLLTDLRLWLEHGELIARSSPNSERVKLETVALEKLHEPALDAIDSLGDRFEAIAASVEADQRPLHINFARRQLHPLLLCSPFAYRTFQKPLGYAGDYEMVNMIMREPFEGSSLFAKVINAWFLNQLPARAHRNRITYLANMLVSETARTTRAGRDAVICDLGCGPAGEIQAFLKESPLSDHARFTLLDFNDETVQHVSSVLGDLKKRHARKTEIQIQKKAVQHILKEAGKTTSSARKFDVIYCAGLFDYLTDRVCRQLVAVFYNWLAPGGLLVVTNVDASRAFRNKLEYILDWNLIYRSGRQVAALAPEQVRVEDRVIKSDGTAVNVFMELRKPED